MELGIPVPRGFQLRGIDEEGKHVARVYGLPGDIRASAAILDRLDGRPISECLTRMERPELEPDPRPEWWPPDDWTDTEALLAYLAKLDEHPEWPRLYNGPAEWFDLAPYVVAGGTVVVREIIRQRGATKRARINADRDIETARIQAEESQE